MNTKKTDQTSIRIDESLPAKADVAESLELTADHPVARGDAPSKPDAADRSATGEKPARTGDGSAKESFVRTQARASRPMRDLPDMILGAGAGADTPNATGEPEGYVRVRVRVREGELRVLDARLVDGPLIQDSGFPAGNLYEFTLDGRLLHAGALPDLGIQRSFPDPAATEGPRTGHHLADRETFEFTARIPAREVTADSVGRVELTLHRVKSEARAERLGNQSLEIQFERDVRPVARLRGLPESIVPEVLARTGKRAANAE